MNVISTASTQWATRPDDQRFLSMAELHAKVASRRRDSRQIDAALEHLAVKATDDGEIDLVSPEGEMGRLTNWSFGQLCQRAKAPAGYLRSLPAELAQIPLQWSLEHADKDDGRILVRRNGHVNVAAINSTTYGRIWDDELTGAVLKHVDLDQWKIPAASYAAKDPKKASTLYASDRDVFLFLVNESNPIEVDNETLFRGFYAWNSEVGSATFGIATFLYRYVCDNRNIWGPRDFREVKIRHTAGGPMRFMHAAVPQLREYANAGTLDIAHTVRNAKSREIAKDKAGVTAWLAARGFTKPVSSKAYDNAERANLNPRSVWGLVQGLTDQGHEMKHTDDRVDLERRAGALLDVVAA